MATKIETNAVVLVSIEESGVVAAVNGAIRRISWDNLRSAARQKDAELARVYRTLLTEAEAQAADGPVVVSVHQDGTNVWWIASVRSIFGDVHANYSRRNDEGMTHPNHMLAACEAEDICQRLGKRVARREGFDGPAAKAKVRKIIQG